MQLQVKDLTKAFGKKVVLKHLNLEMDKGCYGLLGPNGAGKTTLMRCMCGIYPEGLTHIYWEGQSIGDNKNYLKKLGYLPQACGLYKSLSVDEHLELLALYKGVEPTKIRATIDESLRLTGLTERRSSRVGTLSGGMIRRLGVAQALLGDPEILFFDEPTAGLDPEERLRFKNMISDLKKTRLILISTHIVEDVEAVCDWVIIMNKGEIVEELKRNDLRALAEGFVYTIDEQDVDKLKRPYSEIRKYEEDDRIKLRIISPVEQDFPKARASIEDAFVMRIDNQGIFSAEV